MTKFKKFHKGFTLTELMVAVFVFTIAMISTTAIFSRFVIVQKRSRAIQQNMEDARYAMELMAKTLRTGTVVSCNNGGSCSSSIIRSVEFFDYSQQKCTKYYFQNNKVKSASVSVDPGDCDSGAFTAPGNDLVVGNINDLRFGVLQTSSSNMGKVTISMRICSPGGCSGADNDKVDLQTTVSLRDYSEASP